MEKTPSETRIYAYLRVSTLFQEVNVQKEAIIEYCQFQTELKTQPIVFVEEKILGSKSMRPEWERVKQELRRGDTLIIYSLSRLSRRLRELIEIVDFLEKNGINLCVIKESINTNTPSGKLMFHFFGALYQFEVEILKDRTKSALESKRRRNIKGGRKPKNPRTIEIALQLYDAQQMTVSDICKLPEINISRNTFYRYLKLRNEKTKNDVE